MYGSAVYCRLRIYLVIWAHVSLALCLYCPWCMWCYMRLPIAFWDNQQISLADWTKISSLLQRYLQSVFTHWYWSTITVTSDSRIRPIVYTIRSAYLCQIGIEITDYTGDKISVGVARPSHALGQSIPCDGWHSIPGTRVQHMCTKLGIRAQGLITRVIASRQLTDNTGIRSTQLTLLLMRSMCSWLITTCAAASTQYSY